MKTTLWNHISIEPKEAEVSFVESQLCDCKAPIMVEVFATATLAFNLIKNSPYPRCASSVERVGLGVITGNPGALTGICSDCGTVVNLSLGPQASEK